MRWLVTRKDANWWWLGRKLAAGGSDSTESTPATSKVRPAPHGFRWLYSIARPLCFCFMCWRQITEVLGRASHPGSFKVLEVPSEFLVCVTYSYFCGSLSGTMGCGGAVAAYRRIWLSVAMEGQFKLTPHRVNGDHDEVHLTSCKSRFSERWASLRAARGCSLRYPHSEGDLEACGSGSGLGGMPLQARDSSRLAQVKRHLPCLTEWLNHYEDRGLKWNISHLLSKAHVVRSTSV